MLTSLDATPREPARLGRCHTRVEVLLRSGPRDKNRERLKLRAQKLVRHIARRVGLDVVRSDFNSPIVDTRTLPPEIWEQPASLHGIELELERQLDVIEGPLLPFIADLDLPLHPRKDPSELHLDNPWYGPMDAHVLYAMLRNSPPRRVLELGSGFSTLIIDHALQANSCAVESAHEVVDPFPSPLLSVLEGRVRVRQESAAVLDLSVFAELKAGDLLFVDTSHSVRPGGEVVRLVLRILPTLAPGVVVHFHDIFVPFEYPRVFYDAFDVHWQEQYLLEAFLAYNDRFKVLVSNHALWRLHQERVRRIFPGLREGMQPSAFWFVRSAT
jgi:predicted O-methyltransferase YrrM